MSIPVTAISSTGITCPTYADILAAEQAHYRSLYGSDINIDSDTQDGQLLAIRARAIYDSCQMAVAIYNAFSPASAQGAGLASLVKINGLTKLIASNSSAQLTVVGIAGTVITNGVAQDANGNLWNLPATVTIPSGGSITVTAIAQQPGALAAPAGSITQRYTPTAGWQSVTNAADATPGNPIESDSALRQRQAGSTSLPAQTPLQAILANVAQVAGVGRCTIYENQGNTTDSNGVPAHSIAVVVEGGDAAVIAQMIEGKKAPGTGTYGSTSQTVLDPAGVPITIKFYQLTEVPIYAAITIKALAGYVSTTGTALVTAISNFIAALAIGEDVNLAWLYGPAGLSGSPLSTTFKITSLTIGTSSGSLGGSDISIPFTAAASCSPANIVVTVT